jgi:hypothetical protein
MHNALFIRTTLHFKKKCVLSGGCFHKKIIPPSTKLICCKIFNHAVPENTVSSKMTFSLIDERCFMFEPCV